LDLAIELLKGKTVNLRVVEKEDLPLLLEWRNSLEFEGGYNPVAIQQSKTEFEKKHDSRSPDETRFLIEKKDGSKIGHIGTHLFGGMLEIGYAIAPEERGHGYATEAVKIMVDYLFLSRNIVRIGSATHVQNIASQKVLENAGFMKEGTERKGIFVWGKWADLYIYSILREEWKEPKILTKTA
jgi:RimJ/RimL family protein N-acetyltransferase